MSQREDTLGLVFGLGNVGSRKFSPEFDVARRAHERGDSSVGTVSSSASTLGSVNLDVLDDELVSLKLLGDGVGFEVLEKALDNLDRFFGPSSLSDSELAGLAGSGDMAVESLDGDATLVSEDVLEVTLSFLDRFSLQNHGGLISVFEMDTEIIASGLDGLVGSGFARVSLSHGYFIKEVV